MLSSNCSLNHSRLIGGDIYDLFESTFHTQVQVSNGNKLSITNPINKNVVKCLVMVEHKDYGRSMKPFFIEIPIFLGLSKQFGQINFGAFGVFSSNLSASTLVLRVPCPCFPLINYYFYKKLSQFGLQRTRDLTIVCP